jgi:signal transduction histidine kinase
MMNRFKKGMSNRPVWRTSVAMKYAATTMTASLLAIAIISGITLIRLKGEILRTAQVEARTSSRWIADRLELSPKPIETNFFDQVQLRFNMPIALFRRNGTRILGHGFQNISKSQIQTFIAGKVAIIPINQRPHSVAAARIGPHPATEFVLVAAPHRSLQDISNTLLLRYVLIALCLMIGTSIFGYLFGADLSDHLVRLRNRLRAMIAVDRLPVRWSEDSFFERDLSDLDHVLNQFEERFRGELVMYLDALDEVQTLSKQTTTFLGDVARELSVPLDKIIQQSQCLLDGEAGALTTAQTEDVRIIRQAGNRLLDMVNEVLDLSGLIARGIMYDQEPVDLGEVAFEVVETARGGIGDKPVKLSFDTKSNPTNEPGFRVKGSRQRIWQIITNLVSNGIKFTDEGEVRVVVEHLNAEQLAITISDTGVGVPQNELKTIFDPFRQRGDVSKRSRGTGLGLAIVQRLVELHDGELQVKSELRVGSSFKVILPRDQ